MSLRRYGETQGWEAVHDKPSQDLFDNRSLGGLRGRRAGFRPCQLTAQWLRRSGGGQPGDLRLGTDRWRRLGGRWRLFVFGLGWVHGIDRFFLRLRRGPRPRQWGSRVGCRLERCERTRRGSRRGEQGRRSAGHESRRRLAGRVRQGIRRRCSCVSSDTSGWKLDICLRRLGSARLLGDRSGVSALGARGAGHDGCRHEAAGPGADRGRKACGDWRGALTVKAIGRRTRVTE
jgi:hypothetical protein